MSARAREERRRRRERADARRMEELEYVAGGPLRDEQPVAAPSIEEFSDAMVALAYQRATQTARIAVWFAERCCARFAVRRDMLAWFLEEVVTLGATGLVVIEHGAAPSTTATHHPMCGQLRNARYCGCWDRARQAAVYNATTPATWDGEST